MRNPAPHALYERFAQLANPDQVSHHPMCGAHPVLADGPCTCPSGLLAGILAAINAKHTPYQAHRIDSRDCPGHDPNVTRPWPTAAEAQECPHCEATPYLTCSCWSDNYPCPTVVAVAAVMGIGEPA